MMITLLLHGKNRSLFLYVWYMLDRKYIEDSLIFVRVFGGGKTSITCRPGIEIEQKDNL